jgi:hypothetical protein
MSRLSCQQFLNFIFLSVCISTCAPRIVRAEQIEATTMRLAPPTDSVTSSEVAANEREEHRGQRLTSDKPFLSGNLQISKFGSEFIINISDVLINPDIVRDEKKLFNKVGLTYDVGVKRPDAKDAAVIRATRYVFLEKIRYAIVKRPGTPNDRVLNFSATINQEFICVPRDVITNIIGIGEISLYSGQWWDGNTHAPWPSGYWFSEAYKHGENNASDYPVSLSYSPSGCLSSFTILKREKGN